MIKRGDIYFLDLNYYDQNIQKGKRMYLVVSNNVGNAYSNIALVVPLTTKKKRILPTHTILYVTLHNNKSVKNTVLCEQIETVTQNKLKNFMCHIRPYQMTKVNECLRSSLRL